MYIPYALALCTTVLLLACADRYDSNACIHPKTDSSVPTEISTFAADREYGKGALLLSRFDSFEELKSVVNIQYITDADNCDIKGRRPLVLLTHHSAGQTVTSMLDTDVSEKDLEAAQKGGWKKQLRLVLKRPFIGFQKRALQSVFLLSRRRIYTFGEGDVAFFGLAEQMTKNICASDRANMSTRDLSEKGYLNTFNHLTAQAFTTSIFSEKLADFIADIHERRNLKELITGDFTPEQLADLEYGPTDNYVDMINNEWGQELGKSLKHRYALSESSLWTPNLLADYLNDVQEYASRAFDLCFVPFTSRDAVVIRFSYKLNKIAKDGPDMNIP